ncbi:hypothetical protein [Ectobacillus ponti]|uniref:Uncharacterized protein n=1 Tax=Ectobacillus ponti TaxID=2961894 RepID=A0AA41X9Q5_9BACI|nr:hypothetical protein [Ectobacillus ponti]MCP8969485.1 hypothetical protein [Ectobacillus ponti]
MSLLGVFGILSMVLCILLAFYMKWNQERIQLMLQEGWRKTGFFILGLNGLLAACALLGVAGSSDITPYLSIPAAACWGISSVSIWRMLGACRTEGMGGRLRRGLLGSVPYLMLFVLFLYECVTKSFEQMLLAVIGCICAFLAWGGTIFFTVWYRPAEGGQSIEGASESI